MDTLPESKAIGPIVSAVTSSPSPPPPDHNQKGKRKQLSSSMEHIRYAVTVPEEDPNTYGVPGYIQPVRKPRTDSSNNPQKRSDPFQFGSRYLEDGDDIFNYNAWDHVETDDTYRVFAEEQYEKQREAPVTEFDKSMHIFGVTMLPLRHIY
jgi:tRNAThr (cytosine32-N3)-methyltransferase